MINYTNNNFQPWNSLPLHYDSMNRKICYQDQGSWQELQLDNYPDDELVQTEIKALRKIIEVFREKYPEEFL